MKRILLKEKGSGTWAGDGIRARFEYASAKEETGEEQSGFLSEQLPDTGRTLADLRLLKDVPFSYLVPDEKLLPPESIRFFYMDEQWLDAMECGAMSLGRNTIQDAEFDGICFCEVSAQTISQMSVPRFEKMHVNHKKGIQAEKVDSRVRTGFLLRSRLVGQWKGLEVFGYEDEMQLEILRMESLSPEILLCIFSGELTKFVVSQPKTGLRFGTCDGRHIVALRDVRDTDDFGKPFEGQQIDLNEYMQENGRLHVKEMADAMAAVLGEDVKSPQLAFELIAAAARAEFVRGGY